MRWCTATVAFAILFSATSAELDDAPALRIMVKSTVYDVHETRAIFCQATNVEETIQWFYENGTEVKEKKNSEIPRIYVENQPKSGVSRMRALFIHDLQISDTGNWTCKAGELEDTIHIVVGEKVNITARSLVRSGDEGKSISLPCKTKGYPPPVVGWYKDNAPIISDDIKYKIYEDNKLQIFNLNHLDVGQYICKVTQKALSHYIDQTVLLSVKHKPVLYNYEDKTVSLKVVEIFAIMNETKNITCSAVADPPPTYRWYKRNSGNLIPILDEDTVVTDADDTVSVLILRIRNESALGEYKCSAKNTRGEQSVIYHVTIGSKPNPPDAVNIVVSNLTELTFNVTCSTCLFQLDENVSIDPKNLTILGYVFQLVPAEPLKLADWDDAWEFPVAVEDPENTLFTVGPLPNNTVFHTRVCSRNAAGLSDWFEISPDPKTADSAVRATTTLLLILAAFLLTMY